MTADWPLEQQEQTAALVNAVNNELTHYPSKPADMDGEQFNLGHAGTSTSNLFMGSRTFYDNVLGYMSDSDSSNIDRLGHRRWILNPEMQKTMFGMVYAAQKDGYSAPYASMYAFNRDRSSEVSYDYVAWPSAGHFPQELFAAGDAWSVSLNPKRYDKSRISDIKAELKRERDGRTWTFDSGDTNKSGRYFNVETSGYGIPFAVILRPDGVEKYGDDDTYQVRITGLYDNSGGQREVSFKTTFFRLLTSPVARYPIQLDKGETVQLGLRNGAQKIGNTFRSSDKTVATVDANGVVKGIRAGSASVSVDDYLGTSREVYIQVRDKGEKVSKWAVLDYAAAKGNGLVDASYDHSYQKPISRYEFTGLAVQMMETAVGRNLYNDDVAYGNSPFRDVDDWRVTLANKLGIIQGTSGSKFTPYDTITREQAATLLLNLYNAAFQLSSGTSAFAPAGAELTGKVKFGDDGTIAAWAKDNVYKATALSLMKGTGGGLFTPKGKLTYEQTFVILQNVFKVIEAK
ncbi:S-layer homology domain-containing protein [Paenibacillus kobensis]|uniref:S-layer homology domain-containing protein n=1 Tax=Paenibacillus kobensis TaxID=59841 RepID=UPI0013E3D5DC|nr:S-layer homology domain-containing protein [Paenibacillus kobensis]